MWTDIQSRYNAYQVGRNGGWLSPDDMRELENMNPLPGGQGQSYMVPLNMTPLEQFGTDELSSNSPPRQEGSSGPATETRALRSLASRRRTQRAHRPLLREAAGRVVRREVQAGKRAAKSAYGARGDAQFLEWLAEFYLGHREYVERQMLPVLMTMATEVYADAASEIGADEDMTPEMEDFVRSYAATVATRMASSSEGQMRKIMAETPPDELPSALEQRFDEWEEKRPGKVAARESVQAGSAIAKAVWATNGVRRLVVQHH